MKKEIEKIADKLVYAYKKNKLINPIPIKFTKNIENATKLRKLCESKINLSKNGLTHTLTPLFSSVCHTPHTHQLREREREKLIYKSKS